MTNGLPRGGAYSGACFFLTDVDGTLLRRDVPLPPAVAEAARRYTALGGRLALCTGRSLPAAEETARSLKEARRRRHLRKKRLTARSLRRRRTRIPVPENLLPGKLTRSV